MLKTRKDLHEYFDRMLADEKMRTHVLSLFVSIILFALGLFMCVLNLFTGTLYLVFLTGGLSVVLAFIIFFAHAYRKGKNGFVFVGRFCFGFVVIAFDQWRVGRVQPHLDLDITVYSFFSFWSKKRRFFMSSHVGRDFTRSVVSPFYWSSI